MSNPFANSGGGGGPPAIPQRAGKGGESEVEEVVERTLLVKGECLVYRIPPQVSGQEDGGEHVGMLQSYRHLRNYP